MRSNTSLMFNRYWRSYPWYFQLLQLIILIAIMFSFFVLGLGSFLVPLLTGYSLADVAGLNERSPEMLRQAALLWQFLYTLGTFLAPSLLFAYATHPRPGRYLGLVKPGRTIHWLLVPVAMMGLIPVLLQLGHWIEMLPWWSESTRQEAQRLEDLTTIFTTMRSPGEFLKILFLMAVLPAIGEELFFRGVMMRFAAKRSLNVFFPIILTSLMFAFVHMNTYGLLSIFVAAVFLALVYYWTGSLWLSILAHFLNNGAQIVLLYLAENNASVASFAESNEVPMTLFLAGLAIFSVSFWLLWKNRTPLPSSWTEDYDPEELVEEGK